MTDLHQQYLTAKEEMEGMYLLISENELENGSIESYWISRNSAHPIRLVKGKYTVFIESI